MAKESCDIPFVVEIKVMFLTEFSFVKWKKISAHSCYFNCYSNKWRFPKDHPLANRVTHARTENCLKILCHHCCAAQKLT